MELASDSDWEFNFKEEKENWLVDLFTVVEGRNVKAEQWLIWIEKPIQKKDKREMDDFHMISFWSK